MAEGEFEGPVIDIIRRTFGAPNAEITRDTRAGDIDGWDSLSHATLMIMLERRFGINITEEESNELTNVGDLFGLVARKVSQ